ncbi:hypothetical protein [Streptomyces aureocirculatus]|uniref:hypothetical protein n=1 Tax=Streptomyces aureocirculatus TaxID=67275 RepID=UPI0004CB52FB|nr:hypothetical protein [Streptomyces aureocirculatus]
MTAPAWAVLAAGTLALAVAAILTAAAWGTRPYRPIYLVRDTALLAAAVLITIACLLAVRP